MELIVVDTDVFSFITKHDTRAALYEPDLRGRSMALAFMSVAELRLWAMKRRWGTERRAQLESAMDRCQILLPDDAAMTHWAEITLLRARLGRPILCGDAWIAAIARRHGLPLVTHNGKDYANIPGLEVITHAA